MDKQVDLPGVWAKLTSKVGYPSWTFEHACLWRQKEDVKKRLYLIDTTLFYIQHVLSLLLQLLIYYVIICDLILGVFFSVLCHFNCLNILLN